MVDAILNFIKPTAITIVYIKCLPIQYQESRSIPIFKIPFTCKDITSFGFASVSPLVTMGDGE